LQALYGLSGAKGVQPASALVEGQTQKRQKTNFSAHRESVIIAPRIAPSRILYFIAIDRSVN